MHTSPHPLPAITLDGLTKRYGERAAVDDLSLAVPPGAVAGLIGPNGAGKTTVMAMLLGLVEPSAGRATVLGRPVSDPASYLGRVGALIESPAFHPALTGEQNLALLCRLGDHDRSQIPELLDLVGLTGRGGDRYGTYSLGMKQRLGIAAALLGDPALVILDEPTNGVDPAGMRDIRRIIRDIADQGRTILVSSHLLSELEQVCDWLVVIDHGGLVYEGTTDAFGADDHATLVVHTGQVQDLVPLEQVLVQSGLAATRTATSVEITVNGDEPDALAATVNRTAYEAGIVLTELHHERADLEARYFALVQGETP